MSTGRTAEQGSSATEVLARANWPTLHPRLVRGAQRYLRLLGWSEGRDDRPSVLEAHELVNEAVEGCLSGERRFALPPDATEDDLAAYLCMTMRSIAINHRTSAAVALRAGGEALDQQQDEHPSASRRFAEAALLLRIEQIFEGDEEALRVCHAFADDEGQAEIAASLGWTVEHLKVVRRRMSRRLAQQRITLNDDSELAPPGPTSPWSHHETLQAAGPGRRAPGQPDRGPRLARR